MRITGFRQTVARVSQCFVVKQHWRKVLVNSKVVEVQQKDRTYGANIFALLAIFICRAGICLHSNQKEVSHSSLLHKLGYQKHAYLHTRYAKCASHMTGCSKRAARHQVNPLSLDEINLQGITPQNNLIKFRGLTCNQEQASPMWGETK